MDDVFRIAYIIKICESKFFSIRILRKQHILRSICCSLKSKIISFILLFLVLIRDIHSLSSLNFYNHRMILRKNSILQANMIFQQTTIQSTCVVNKRRRSAMNMMSTNAIKPSNLPKLLDIPMWDDLTRCIVLEIPKEPITNGESNHVDEFSYIWRGSDSSLSQDKPAKISAKRINTYLGGRQALRQALSCLNQDFTNPILKDEHGCPILPLNLQGSISHKDSYVAGLATTREDRGKIGVDLERCYNKAAEQMQRRLLTDTERKSLGSLQSDGMSIEQEVLLRFSFKEAIYKALHPQVLRPIGFHEAEVYPQPNGSVDIKLHLNNADERNYNIEGIWIRFLDDYWLTAVRIWT